MNNAVHSLLDVNVLWKCWQVTEHTGNPRASKRYKTLKYDISKRRRKNVIGINLVHQQPATFSARFSTSCVVHILDSLSTTSPICNDETRRIDGSVHRM